jgi:hypothetical protein
MNIDFAQGCIICCNCDHSRKCTSTLSHFIFSKICWYSLHNLNTFMPQFYNVRSTVINVFFFKYGRNILHNITYNITFITWWQETDNIHVSNWIGTNKRWCKSFTVLGPAQSPGVRQFWVMKVGQGLMYFKVFFL